MNSVLEMVSWLHDNMLYKFTFNLQAITTAPLSTILEGAWHTMSRLDTTWQIVSCRAKWNLGFNKCLHWHWHWLKWYLDDAGSLTGCESGMGGSWKMSGSDWPLCGGGGAETAAVAPPCWLSTASPITWYLSNFDISFFEERFDPAMALSVRWRRLTYTRRINIGC